MLILQLCRADDGSVAACVCTECDDVSLSSESLKTSTMRRITMAAGWLSDEMCVGLCRVLKAD